MPRYLVSGSCIGGVMVTHNRTCSTIGLLCTLRTTGKHADSMKSVPFYSCLLIHLPRCQPNLVTYIPNDKLKRKVCRNSLLTMTVATLQQLKCWRPTVKCFRRVPYNVQAFCRIPRIQQIGEASTRACVIESKSMNIAC